MWVSTTGEDSPQCIHDMPASVHGPVPLTHQPCRSLNYALRNIQNETINEIFITCGVHVLKPFDSPDATLLLNDTTTVIEGTCAGAKWYNDLPLIQCTDGANMAFYNVQQVVIKHLSFQDCGEQVQHSDSLSDSSTLYFQDCKTVVVQYSVITITGPYGSGISFKNGPTITPGNVHIGFVDIEHYGIHGTGIHFEIFTAMTKDIDFASVKFELNNTVVFHEHIHPRYDPIMRFTGINITVMGDGEGGEITLSNVTVGRTTRGNGISIAVLDRVLGVNVHLTDTSILALDLVEWEDSNNMTVNHIPCDEHVSNISQSGSIDSNSYFGIKIEIRGKCTGNRIQVRTSFVDECRGNPGSAFSIEITDESEKNVVQFYDVGSSSGYRRGLQVIVTGWARRNVVHVDALDCSEHRALWGAGGYIEFSGHAQGNLVHLRNSTFVQNHAIRGGGIAVVCRDFAT